METLGKLQFDIDLGTWQNVTTVHVISMSIGQRSRSQKLQNPDMQCATIDERTVGRSVILATTLTTWQIALLEELTQFKGWRLKVKVTGSTHRCLSVRRSWFIYSTKESERNQFMSTFTHCYSRHTIS